jgi:hypothetical protein
MRVFVVPLIVTATVGDCDVAYKLLAGVKSAVTLSLPAGRELVTQVAVPTPGETVVPDPVTVVV